VLPLQVNWYAVLGNHDYGDKIDPDEDSCAANTLDACPQGCCYSSVWQVRAAAAAAAADGIVSWVSAAMRIPSNVPFKPALWMLYELFMVSTLQLMIALHIGFPPGPSHMQFTGRVNDVRWHCQNGTYNVPTGNAGLLDIIMMDTNPFMPHYQKEAWAKNAGGRSFSQLQDGMWRVAV
jgi:hypothetical protein